MRDIWNIYEQLDTALSYAIPQIDEIWPGSELQFDMRD